MSAGDSLNPKADDKDIPAALITQNDAAPLQHAKTAPPLPASLAEADSGDKGEKEGGGHGGHGGVAGKGTVAAGANAALGVEDDRFFFSEEDDRCVTKTFFKSLCLRVHAHAHSIQHS